MADKGFPNAKHLQVKVFGEKEGRYDLEKLPKLVHSKKYKPDKRKRRKLTDTSSCNVDEVDVEQQAQGTSTSSTPCEFESFETNVDDNRNEEPTTSTFKVRELA